MRRFALLPLATLIAAGPATAANCKDDITKIDMAMTSVKLEADKKQQVTDLREQADKLCASGKEQLALDNIAEAKAILNLE